MHAILKNSMILFNISYNYHKVELTKKFKYRTLKVSRRGKDRWWMKKFKLFEPT